MRVLIFGDSITEGKWDRQGGWAQRLINDYLAQGIADLEADVPLLSNLGVSADSTLELLARFEHETKARQRPDMAFVFAIGTNDSRIDGTTALRTVEQYRANLQTLIAKASTFASPDKILFVGLPPCDEARTTPVSWRDTSYTNERIKQFDQTIQKVCAKLGTHYVPVFEPYQAQQATKGDMLLDGLHPDDAGHNLIYEQVKPALQILLSS
jgi:lysophospholipase L1-like esterase